MCCPELGMSSEQMLARRSSGGLLDEVDRKEASGNLSLLNILLECKKQEVTKRKKKGMGEANGSFLGT